MIKNTVKNRLSMKQKDVNNHILHSLLSCSLISTSFTLMSSYKSSYTNKSSTTVYKSSYITTMNIFRMKKYNKKFKKEVKNNEENVIKLFSIIDIFMKSWHSEKQWKSFSKYVEFRFNLQTIALLIVYNVFFDVTNSAED